MIPFNRPHHVARSVRLIEDAAEGGHLSGDGPWTRQVSEQLGLLTGARRALLTTSCTAALEMSALLLDFEPGDEVLVPSFTFVSTVNAFLLHGATPVFVDVRPDTLNVDERLVEGLITDRTRAIVAVHYGGVACELEALGQITDRHGISLIEDNAHGLGGSYRGQPLGSFGRMATLSFHETKNLQCGEGGALLINDPALVQRAEIIREKGTNRARFFRGEVDKYTWVDVGSSYLLSEILSAYLAGQVEVFDGIQARRRLLWDRYADSLRTWAKEFGAQLPVVPDDCVHPAHLFHVLLPTADQRDGLLTWLREQGVHAVFHYLPLDRSPMGRRLAPDAECPVSADVAGRLLRLPLYPDLTDAEQATVIDAVLSWRGA